MQEPHHQIADRYATVRKTTREICARLETEDQTVQPCAEVSPPKWHLAHTTWFFEEMILRPFASSYKPVDDSYRVLFNSYYKSVGQHWLQGERGQLSRPTVKEVLRYRDHVDHSMMEFLEAASGRGDLAAVLELTELGIHHEEQHQELLLMDIKFILGVNPSVPAFESKALARASRPVQTWSEFSEGVYEVGHAGVGFAFDNEKPRHKTYINPYAIADAVVTNGEYRKFVEDHGYDQPSLWLSAGWDWVTANKVENPQYWQRNGSNWDEFTLHGLVTLNPDAPVTHISYFEADAYATWAGSRLPTEHEAELFLAAGAEDAAPTLGCIFHPTDANARSGQVWFWTRSHYSPYPGFRPGSGPAAEYNGKFMCGQFVLRGSCIVTPHRHARASYRNFYLPHQRWMFSGIRLAKDL